MIGGVVRLVAGLVILLGSAALGARPASTKPTQLLRLWPGRPPGTEDWTGAEQTADVELPNLGKVHIVTNVTTPTLSVYAPPRSKATRTAMIVVPGGAFRALPWDLDGVETASWLNARGITAFVLKYRVRPPITQPNDRNFEDFARRTENARKIAVADAEQAVRLVRSHASQYAIDPLKIGMIGFSAGAMTSLSVAVDKGAARPNFVVSLYGALLSKQAPDRDAPPAFIVAAQDDPEAPAVMSSEIFERWTAAGRPAELHIYEKGGHGFAFRAHHVAVDNWPGALQAWLVARGFLGNRKP